MECVSAKTGTNTLFQQASWHSIKADGPHRKPRLQTHWTYLKTIPRVVQTPRHDKHEDRRIQSTQALFAQWLASHLLSPIFPPQQLPSPHLRSFLSMTLRTFKVLSLCLGQSSLSHTSDRLPCAVLILHVPRSTDLLRLDVIFHAPEFTWREPFSRKLVFAWLHSLIIALVRHIQIVE